MFARSVWGLLALLVFLTLPGLSLATLSVGSLAGQEGWSGGASPGSRDLAGGALNRCGSVRWKDHRSLWYWWP